MNLLTLHPSFWTGEIIHYSAPRLNARTVQTEKSFIRWQALRRNERYGSWAVETYTENKQFFEGKAFFDKYFTDYTPKASSQTFTEWRQWVINKTRRTKTAEDIEWEIDAKKVVWKRLPKGLRPDRWLPIP